jgi:hypothetical protein
MEKSMRVLVTAVGTILVVCGSAAAQPPKSAPAKRPQPTQSAPQQRPEIVLASAEALPAPAGDHGSVAEPKRRVTPRVTTCRCGDPQAAPDTEEQ